MAQVFFTSHKVGKNSPNRVTLLKGENYSAVCAKKTFSLKNTSSSLTREVESDFA